jgi:hypothetical protein
MGKASRKTRSGRGGDPVDFLLFHLCLFAFICGKKKDAIALRNPVSLYIIDGFSESETQRHRDTKKEKLAQKKTRSRPEKRAKTRFRGWFSSLSVWWHRYGFPAPTGSLMTVSNPVSPSHPPYTNIAVFNPMRYKPIDAQCPRPNAQCPRPNAPCPRPKAQGPRPKAQGPRPKAQGPRPYAQCPMPYAQCPMPYALCPMP